MSRRSGPSSSSPSSAASTARRCWSTCSARCMPGQAAFEDTAEALAAIAAALRYGGGWLDWLAGCRRRPGRLRRHQGGPRAGAAAGCAGGAARHAGGGAAGAGGGGRGRHQRACAGLAPLHRGCGGDPRRPAGRRGARHCCWPPAAAPRSIPARSRCGRRSPASGSTASSRCRNSSRRSWTRPGGSGVPHLGLDALLAALIGDLL